MTIQEAIKARHSVRKFTDQPIEVAKVATPHPGCIINVSATGE